MRLSVDTLACELSNLRLAVTGGNGLVGRAVVSRLRAVGCRHLTVVCSQEYDLCTEQGVWEFYRDHRPEAVIHLAGVAGGIAANIAHPGRFFYQNAVMGLQMIEHARRCGVTTFVTVGTVCSYPGTAPVPLRERDLWDGYPEASSASYGLAKRTVLAQLQAYRREYGLRSVYLIPANLYGPGDDFSLATANVIPAIMRKCDQARRTRQDHITLMGDGGASREFLYAEDAAEGIIRAAVLGDSAEPINLGCGREIAIHELARRIADITDYRGRILWDAFQPAGRRHRCLDTTLARSRLDFVPRTTLQEGLQATYTWFTRNRHRLADPQSGDSPEGITCHERKP